MKKLLLLLPFLVIGLPALAVDIQDEENYKKHYTEQLKPLVMKKLSLDRPDMSAKAIKAEANAYVTKMAGCQLEGIKHFPEQYREKAILPVAQGEDIATTTQALNQTMMQDIEAGKMSKDEAMTMIQNAQETVQICVNS